MNVGVPPIFPAAGTAGSGAAGTGTAGTGTAASGTTVCEPIDIGEPSALTMVTLALAVPVPGLSSRMTGPRSSNPSSALAAVTAAELAMITPGIVTEVSGADVGPTMSTPPATSVRTIDSCIVATTGPPRLSTRTTVLVSPGANPASG